LVFWFLFSDFGIFLFSLSFCLEVCSYVLFPLLSSFVFAKLVFSFFLFFFLVLRRVSFIVLLGFSGRHQATNLDQIRSVLKPVYLYQRDCHLLSFSLLKSVAVNFQNRLYIETFDREQFYQILFYPFSDSFLSRVIGALSLGFTHSWL